MTEQKIKVFTYSQQPLFQEGIRQTLFKMGDVQIMGQSKVTDKTLVIEVMPPDVVILDIDAPSDSGLGLALRLKQLIPNLGVITLTSFPSDDQLFQALETQVSAYLSKEISDEQLASMVRRVAIGENPIQEILSKQPKVAGKILRQFQKLSGKTEVETLVPTLTSRETEILNHIAQGFSNKQIAAKLSISEQTTKNHVASIMLKLNANARTQAVVIAVQKGLISIEQS
jgi:two-component system NarL family response regulator